MNENTIGSRKLCVIKQKYYLGSSRCELKPRKTQDVRSLDPGRLHEHEAREMIILYIYLARSKLLYLFVLLMIKKGVLISGISKMLR